MIGMIAGFIVHGLLVFANTTLCIVAEDRDIIEDKDLWLIIGLFVPLGTILVMAGLCCGEYLSDRLP